jgi:hypothetical protein
MEYYQTYRFFWINYREITHELLRTGTESVDVTYYVMDNPM